MDHTAATTGTLLIMRRTNSNVSVAGSSTSVGSYQTCTSTTTSGSEDNNNSNDNNISYDGSNASSCRNDGEDDSRCYSDYDSDFDCDGTSKENKTPRRNQSRTRTRRKRIYRTARRVTAFSTNSTPTAAAAFITPTSTTTITAKLKLNFVVVSRVGFLVVVGLLSSLQYRNALYLIINYDDEKMYENNYGGDHVGSVIDPRIITAATTTSSSSPSTARGKTRTSNVNMTKSSKKSESESKPSTPGKNRKPTTVPVFYNVFVRNKYEIEFVQNNIVDDQLRFLDPTIHGPVYYTSLGPVPINITFPPRRPPTTLLVPSDSYYEDTTDGDTISTITATTPVDAVRSGDASTATATATNTNTATIASSDDIVNISRIQHVETGDETTTLHSLWSYCQDHPTERVVYLHSKGSFHPTKQNDDLRRLVTAAALSKECSEATRRQQQQQHPNQPHLDDDDPSGHCDVCSARFSPLPHAHTSGNMWMARCDYVSKLLDPQTVFRNVMDDAYPISDPAMKHLKDVLDRLEFRNGQKLHCFGLGRYAAEHWIHSHPSVRPCDVYKDPEFVWGYKGIPPSPSSDAGTGRSEFVMDDGNSNNNSRRKRYYDFKIASAPRFGSVEMYDLQFMLKTPCRQTIQQFWDTYGQNLLNEYQVLYGGGGDGDGGGEGIDSSIHPNRTNKQLLPMSKSWWGWKITEFRERLLNGTFVTKENKNDAVINNNATAI